MDFILNNNSLYNQKLLEIKNEIEIFLNQFSRLQIVIYTTLICILVIQFYSWYRDHELNLSAVYVFLFRCLIKLPFISSFVNKELKKAENTISETCRAIYCNQKFLVELPKKGFNAEEIFAKFKNYENLSKIEYKKGRVSGAVYSNMKLEPLKIVKEIYGQTAFSNPLHPDIFPGITKMEAEIIRMVINLYNGDDNCCGILTSGGTESIVLAIKAYRDYARKYRNVQKPELVAPQTAHAAFEKACQYFCIKYRPIPVDPVTFKADVKAMKRAINSNTILLVGSACGYPHGIIDDIQSLSEIALKYNIPLHVDCCLGGFLVPFVEAAGFPMETVDFRLKGVTSISVDTHKYGYTPKGSSLIMYSDNKYRSCQFSIQTDWPGGIYVTPTIAGSRCGANIATCWATLLHYGYEGYVNNTKEILSKQRFLKEELKKIPEIFIMGDPQLSVIAIGSNNFNIFRLSDLLTTKGWNLNPLQFPSGFHICLTMMHVADGVIDDFLNDLKENVAICMKDPQQKTGGAGVIYGMAQSIPDRSLVSDMAIQYLNSIYDTSD